MVVIISSNVLFSESSGYLEAEEGTVTSHITQKDIKDAVDITSAAKTFDLNLRHFGPYKMQFTKNGRHLVLGGRKGHLAAMDWITKKLLCEINVMESIHDVCWLHTEQMMVAAQKKWVYIYDNNGIELHCIKKLNRVLKLEFLPYHFLLCAGDDTGFLSWLDVTLGKEVIQIFTHKGRLEIMCQNPYNAVLCCGHPNGTVTMWTPNSQEPVASVFCHHRPIRAVEFDPSGRYMATSGDRRVKIWDARNLGQHLQCYSTRSVVSHLSFSQRRLLAMSMDNVVEVYQNVTTGGASEAYMRHNSGSTITDMQFCPYEDILGISTYHGYSSLIIPGAGEPNFDALEANPYESVSGRREAEVKSLLSKVPADLITLDPLSIGQVDLPRLQEKLDAKNALLYVRKPKIDFTPRYRMKGKSNSAQKFKRKQKMKESQQRDYLKAAVLQRENFGIGKTKKIKKIVSESAEILDRFKPKEKMLH
ncbi:WD repeat-containing protein 46 [Panulirus ornatus]|uniref:WD repeat-containing protein 46 n=1 Tax=Panulirus ornatus TaxID=150431 RepID=UPI003A87E41A